MLCNYLISQAPPPFSAYHRPDTPHWGPSKHPKVDFFNSPNQLVINSSFINNNTLIQIGLILQPKCSFADAWRFFSYFWKTNFLIAASHQVKLWLDCNSLSVGQIWFKNILSTSTYSRTDTSRIIYNTFH